MATGLLCIYIYVSGACVVSSDVGFAMYCGRYVHPCIISVVEGKSRPLIALNVNIYSVGKRQAATATRCCCHKKVFQNYIPS